MYSLSCEVRKYNIIRRLPYYICPLFSANFFGFTEFSIQIFSLFGVVFFSAIRSLQVIRYLNELHFWLGKTPVDFAKHQQLPSKFFMDMLSQADDSDNDSNSNSYL